MRKTGGHFLLIIIFLSTVCFGGEMNAKQTQFLSIKEVPDSAWKQLAEKKIYFGHQSVGFNILDGVKDLMRENPQIKLNLVETKKSADFKVGVFAHSTVGENMNPQSKIDDFTKFMEKGIGKKADVAFLKFCYIDFQTGSDVQKIFNQYKNALSQLKKSHPQANFVHITVPLTSQQTGVKAWIKKILGKPLRGFDDNIKRNQYNTMLKKEYEGRDPVFDLMEIESTFPDGTRSTFTKNGNTYYSLVQEYSDDGAHLNITGRKVAAEKLLLFLVNMR